MYVTVLIEHGNISASLSLFMASTVRSFPQCTDLLGICGRFHHPAMTESKAVRLEHLVPEGGK